MLAKARFSRWLNFRVFQHNPQKAVIPERLGERAKSTEAVRKPDARLCIVARRTDFHVFPAVRRRLDVAPQMHRRAGYFNSV